MPRIRDSSFRKLFRRPINNAISMRLGAATGSRGYSVYESGDLHYGLFRDLAPHFRSVQDRLSGLGEIPCPMPRSQRGLHGRLNAGGFPFQVERVAQQHGRRQNRAQRIGDSFPRDVGRGAMNRFIEPDRPTDTG